MERCGDCYFFDAKSHHCRRYPPHLVILPGAVGQPGIAGAWVAVKPDTWCGEFKSKQEA